MIRIILLIFSFLVILTGVARSVDWWWTVLPLSFIILNIIFPKLYFLSKNRAIYFIYFLISFLRYVFTPFLFILSYGEYDNYILKDVSDSSLKMACLFMILELTISLFFINIFSKINVEKSKIYKFNSNQFLIFLSFLIFSLFFLIPDLVYKYNFILVPDELIKSDIEFFGSGFIFILADYILWIPPVIISSFFIRRYFNDFNKKNIYLALIFIIPFLLFFRGLSRFSALLPALAWLIAFNMVLPKFKKAINISILSTALLVLTSVTLFKQFGYQKDTSLQEVGVNFSEIAVTFNAYFSGLLNVAYVIEIERFFSLQSGYNYFVNDLLKNLMFFSKFSDNDKTSSYFFNNYIFDQSGRYDQIVPIVGQSYLYFGYAGVAFLTAVCVILMIKLEYTLYKIKNYNYIFPVALLTIYLSLSMMITINSIYSVCFNYILPLLFILKVNDFFSRIRFK